MAKARKGQGQLKVVKPQVDPGEEAHRLTLIDMQERAQKAANGFKALMAETNCYPDIELRTTVNGHKFHLDFRANPHNGNTERKGGKA